MKLLLCVWFWYALIVRTSYQGVLLSSLAVPTLPPVISSFHELAKEVKAGRYGCGAQRHTSPAYEMLELTDELQILGEHLRQHDDHLYDTIEDGLHKVLEGRFASYGFLEAHLYVAKLMGAKYVLNFGESIHESMIFMAFRKRFPYRRQFSAIMSRCMETGLIDYWIKKHTGPGGSSKYNTSKRVKETYFQEAKKTSSLKMNDVKGSFYLLLFGCLMATVVLIAEHICNYVGGIRTTRTRKVTLSH